VLAVNPEDRIDSIDAIRGIALFGVLTVNLVTEFRVSLFQQFLSSEATGADLLVENAVSLVLEQKAFSLFALIFGVGLGIQYERLSATGRPFYWLTRAHGRYLASMEAVLRGMGLDAPRWRVLMTLHEDNRASVSEIAEHSNAKLSTRAKIVRRMKQDGFVACSPTMRGSPKSRLRMRKREPATMPGGPPMSCTSRHSRTDPRRGRDTQPSSAESRRQLEARLRGCVGS